MNKVSSKVAIPQSLRLKRLGTDTVRIGRTERLLPSPCPGTRKPFRDGHRLRQFPGTPEKHRKSLSLALMYLTGFDWGNSSQIEYVFKGLYSLNIHKNKAGFRVEWKKKKLSRKWQMKGRGWDEIRGFFLFLEFVAKMIEFQNLNLEYSVVIFTLSL